MRRGRICFIWQDAGKKESRNTRSLQFRPEKASPGIAPQSKAKRSTFFLGGDNKRETSDKTATCSDQLQATIEATQHAVSCKQLSFHSHGQQTMDPCRKGFADHLGTPSPHPHSSFCKGRLSPAPVRINQFMCIFLSFRFPLPPLVSCFSQ